MTRQQAVTMIIINAVISLIISLSVVLLADRYRANRVTEVPTATAVVAAASTTETAVVTTTNGPAPVATYVVKSGDSLSSIAYKFGISSEALKAANGIENANYITIGQTLLIPQGASLAGATATASVAATLPAVLTPEGGKAPIVITAITLGDTANDEYITISNQGSKGVALEGWTLRDEDAHVYTFPNLLLWRSGTVLLHTGSGTDSATDLYWGLNEPTWRIGEKITLRDADGNLISELVATGE